MTLLHTSWEACGFASHKKGLVHLTQRELMDLILKMEITDQKRLDVKRAIIIEQMKSGAFTYEDARAALQNPDELELLKFDNACLKMEIDENSNKRQSEPT